MTSLIILFSFTFAFLEFDCTCCDLGIYLYWFLSYSRLAFTSVKPEADAQGEGWGDLRRLHRPREPSNAPQEASDARRPLTQLPQTPNFPGFIERAVGANGTPAHD